MPFLGRLVRLAPMILVLGMTFPAQAEETSLRASRSGVAISHSEGTALSVLRHEIRRYERLKFRYELEGGHPENAPWFRDTPRARRMAAWMRAKLGSWVFEHLPENASDLPAVQKRLNKRLWQQGVVREYGGFRPLRLERLKASPELIVLRLETWMSDDDSAYVFRRAGNAWQEVLRVDTGMVVEKLLDVKEADGGALLLLHGYDSWGPSSWRQLRYRLYRLPKSGPARLLAKDPGGIVLHRAMPLEVRFGPTRLRFRFSGNKHYEELGEVLEYRIKPTKASR